MSGFRDRLPRPRWNTARAHLIRTGWDFAWLTAWAFTYFLFSRLGPAIPWWESIAVGSAAAVEGVLEAVGAAIIAVYGLGLASVFVIAQLITPARGSRSVRVLLLDWRFRGVLSGAILLVALTVWLASKVPERQPVEDRTAQVGDDLSTTVLVETLSLSLSDLATGLAVVTVALLLATVLCLASLFYTYNSPRKFGKIIRRRIRKTKGARDLLEQTKLLRQWMCSAAYGGQSIDLRYACEAAIALVKRYTDRAEKQWVRKGPDYLPRRERVTGWFGQELSASLVRAGEVALRGAAARRDLDTLVDTLYRSTEQAISKKVKKDKGEEGKDGEESVLTEDARAFIGGLIELGCTAGKSTPETMSGWGRYAADRLAQLAELAAKKKQVDLAAQALAGWALVVHETRAEGSLHQAGLSHLRHTQDWTKASTHLEEVGTSPKALVLDGKGWSEPIEAVCPRWLRGLVDAESVRGVLRHAEATKRYGRDTPVARFYEHLRKKQVAPAQRLCDDQFRFKTVNGQYSRDTLHEYSKTIEDRGLTFSTLEPVPTDVAVMLIEYRDGDGKPHREVHQWKVRDGLLSSCDCWPLTMD